MNPSAQDSHRIAREGGDPRPAWLVTGAAGFIGMHVCERLLARGERVVGVDILSDYYDVSLKRARLDRLLPHPSFSFSRTDIADTATMAELFARVQPARVIHLAAQPGVRHSITHPHVYVQANVAGFLNVLEGCRHGGVQHLVYASSSSVYGGNEQVPFREGDRVDHPVSLYAATKKANELMAHTYSHLYGLPTTGLRFFTVYGPWGRPDMAPWLFTEAILQGRAIDVFNHGDMQRDFTYIDDIVEGVLRVADKPATPDPAFDATHPDPATARAPYRVLNIGNCQPTPLLGFIGAIEDALGMQARKRLRPIQPGDVPVTAASTDRLDAWVGFRPSTPLREGVTRFVDWYRSYIGGYAVPERGKCPAVAEQTHGY
jgi:UDP-glucuronate 4-epimerase